MGLGILVLITALAISAVAIYYSVAGLVAIFAAAAIPIIVMGTTLEIAKLVTAVWLHKYWNRTVWWLKTYLVAAMLVLMLITSMGIFGFLSKAHIEQSTASGESTAQIERIISEIARQESILERANAKIQQVETTGTGADANIQQQIDREQARVDTAYERIQSAEQALATRIAPFQTELDSIAAALARLEAASAANDVKTIQSIVGETPDGVFGRNTTASVERFRATQAQRRDELTAQIQSVRNSSDSINIAQQQVIDSNELISRLRSQLGQGTASDVDAIVDEQQSRIAAADLELDALTEEKYKIEAELRKLEAEVGPIKYIAEFIYDSADKNVLEESVRWMIVIIIFVFDPLAVLLLIASQYTFHYYKQDKPKEKILPEVLHSMRPKQQRNYSIMDTFEDLDYIRESSIPDINIDNESEQIRSDLYNRMDTDIKMKSKKQLWKADHPNETVKEYKNAYIKGHIDKLPWDNDAESNSNNNST
jgi:hypothetical protein